jgi:hypothetical protein
MNNVELSAARYFRTALCAGSRIFVRVVMTGLFDSICRVAQRIRFMSNAEATDNTAPARAPCPERARSRNRRIEQRKRGRRYGSSDATSSVRTAMKARAEMEL